MIGRIALASALAVCLSGPAASADRLGTLPAGRYLCELPGDAVGLASRPVDRLWFDIVNPSSYVGAEGRGTYLLTGETVLFTRGPLRGAKFERHGERTLRWLNLSDDYAKLRCVRTGRSEKP